MKKTTNYQLNQWEKSDRILMDDFNSDNAKLEAALSNRNCQFYTTTYVGQGSGITQTLTFPHKPMAVFIMGNRRDINSYIFLASIRNAPYLQGDGRSAIAEWGERTFSWSPCSAGASFSGNLKGIDYNVLALLDPDD